MSKNNYKVPSQTIVVQQEIKKSKFIATVGRASGTKSAKSFIDEVSAEYNDATHNCYAFVAGNPHGTTDIGFGDDGEVSGTAGMPMLNILQHKGIGEIVAVVSRYYGGTKLGTGGLVRAYSGTLQLALDELELTEYVQLKSGKITFSYEHENSVRNLLSMMDVDINNVDYSEHVEIEIQITEDDLTRLSDEIASQTHGQAVLKF